MKKGWINKPTEEWQLNTGIKYYCCTIPLDIAEKLNLKPGDRVEIEIEGEKIIIKKVDSNNQK